MRDAVTRAKIKITTLGRRIGPSVVLLLTMLAAVPQASALTAQTIQNFTPPMSITYSIAKTFILSATGGASGNPVTFTSANSTVCTVAGSTATVVAVGTCMLRANQAGNATFSAASQVSRNVTINKGTQNITFATVTSKTLGMSPVTLSASSDSGLTVSLTSTTTTVCTVAGVTVTLLKVGTCTINANQASNTNFNAAAQITRQFPVTAMLAQTIQNFTPPMSITYSIAKTFILSATGGASGNPVTFTSANSTVCTVAGSTATVVAGGICTLRANQAGNTTYNAAFQISANVSINTAGQTISFDPLSDRILGTGPFTVSATSDSGLTVTFTSTTTTICTVAGATVTLVKVGTCTIAANRAGNANYSAAMQVTRSFSVTALPPQTITNFSLPTSITYSPNWSTQLTATGGPSGNPVTFSTTNAAICSIDTGVLTMLSAGTCTVKADQAGNASYGAAPQLSGNMVINMAGQTISFPTVGTTSISYSPINSYAQANSGLPVTLSSTTTSICTPSGAAINLLQTGSCTIRANQAGNASYNAAPQITRTFTVDTTALTIKIASPLDGATFVAPATVPITFNTSTYPGTPIIRVDYYSNGFRVDSAPPDSPRSLTNLAARTYDIYATAIDAANNQRSSNTIQITVGPPTPHATVVLTSPAADASYAAPATITLAASAAPIAPGTSISRVDFFNGATLLGTRIAAPYTYNWTNVPVGRYALTAVATDNLGATGTSAVVYAVVDGADTCDSTPPLSARDPASTVAAFDKLPITFEQNMGQTNAEVKFQARGPGYQFFLTEQARLMVLHAPLPPARRKNMSEGPFEQADTRSVAVRLRYVGANPHPLITAHDPVTERSNFFVGQAPAQWHTDVPHFARARYHDLYPGIDEVYSGSGGSLEYDLHVSPGANPAGIRLAFDGIDGMSIGDDGDLLLETARGMLVQKRPVAYQIIAGERRQIDAAYARVDDDVRFVLGDYDAAHELIIDPVLVYSTFLGGNFAGSVANALAVSRCGEVYVVGQTSALDFPTTTGAFDPVGNPYYVGAHMGFVAKLNASGTGLIYSSYLTGKSYASSTDARSVVIDATGQAYVGGFTSASDFPTTAAAALATNSGGFVLKLNHAGNGFAYSTFVEGTQVEQLAIDNAGAAYVVAGNSLQKISPSGSSFDYAVTFGSNSTYTQAVAVDGAGNAYVAGTTSDPEFPVTPGAFQTTIPSYASGFVSKINPAGTGFVYSTFLGSTMGTDIAGIVLDDQGNAFVAGSDVTGGTVPNYSGPYPLATQGFDEPGNRYAFVSELAANGGQLLSFVRFGGDYCWTIYQTVYCSSAYTSASALALDRLGNVWITGSTTSNQILLVKPLATQYHSSASSPDLFVARLAISDSSFRFSTLLGGQTEIPPSFGGVITGAYGLAVDSVGSAYIAGATNRSDFPTTAGALQTALSPGAGYGAFVVKINDSKDTTTTIAASPVTVFVGSPVTFTATIVGNAPTGTVTFVEGSTPLGTAQVTGTSAPFTATANFQLPIGGHGVLAQYSGDAHNSPSWSSYIDAIVIYAPEPNSPPSITLTGIADGAVLFPNAGASYTNPSLTMSANAAPGNTLKAITRFHDGVAPDTWYISQASFSHTDGFIYWYPGFHWLYVSATDNFDHTTSTALVRFVVNPVGTSPPAVSITAPVNGSSVNIPGPLTVTATATASPGNSIANVTYYRDGISIGGAATPPYSVTWSNISAGTYSLVAVAIDSAGASQISAPVLVTAHSAPGAPGAPTLTSATGGPSSAILYFTAPSNGGGSAITGYNGTCIASGLSPRSASAPASPIVINGLSSLAVGGTYSCSVSAINGIGVGPPSNIVNVVPGGSVVITAPINSTVVGATTQVDFVVSAQVAPNTITKIDIFDGATLLSSFVPPGGTTAIAYSYSWHVSSLGSHALSARVTDSAGTITISSVVTVVAFFPPSVTLNVAGSFFLAPAAIDLSAEAASTDAAIAKVEFFNGTTLLATRVSPPYTYRWSGVGNGSYTLTAKATDTRTLSATTAPLNVAVWEPHVLPTVTLVSPANNTVFGAPAAITLNATATTAGVNVNKVEFYANGNIVGTANSAPWTANWSPVSAGSYTVTAQAFDALSGVAASPPATVIVGSFGANTPPISGATDQVPVVVMAAPISGSAYPQGANITLTASASDADDFITKIDFYQNGILLGTANPPGGQPPASGTTTLWTMVWTNVPTGSFKLTAIAYDVYGLPKTSSPIYITVGIPGQVETITYLHNDFAGNPIGATDASGSLLWRETYKPFGERFVNQDSAAGNRQWFGGKAFDTDTGLSYFGARYYDSALGRFMGVDPKEMDPSGVHSFNRYAYANDNPYRFIDPNGRSPILFYEAFVALAPRVLVWLGSRQGTALAVAEAGAMIGSGAIIPSNPLVIGTAAQKTVNLALRYKPDWTEAQRVEAAAKVQFLNGAETVVTDADRAGSAAAARRYRKANQVETGRDVDHMRDIQLGGGNGGENLGVLDASVNRSLGAQIQQQIKDLPEGTIINQITIGD